MKRPDPEIVSQLSNMVHIIAKTTVGLKYVRLSETYTTPSPPLASVMYYSGSGGYSCVNTIIKKRVQV